MPSSVAAVVAGTVVSGLISKRSSDKAIEAQEGASAAEIAELRRQFDLTRADTAPAREAQKFALERLIGLIQDPSQVENLPGFQFRRAQGREALEESAAAGGGLFTGNTLQALEEFGQGFATSEVNQEFNRLSNLAGLGAGGVNAGISAGGALSSRIAGAERNLGANQAGAFLREGNIAEDIINSISTNAAFAGRLRNLQPGSAPFTPIPRTRGLVGSGAFRTDFTGP